MRKLYNTQGYIFIYTFSLYIYIYIKIHIVYTCMYVISLYPIIFQHASLEEEKWSAPIHEFNSRGFNFWGSVLVSCCHYAWLVSRPGRFGWGFQRSTPDEPCSRCPPNWLTILVILVVSVGGIFGLCLLSWSQDRAKLPMLRWLFKPEESGVFW